MEYNHTWTAISQPGETNPYFSQPHFQKINLSNNQFNLNNAWWFMEICRLTYKFDRDLRINILKANGFYDIHEMNVGRSFGLVCSTLDINEDPIQIIAFKGTDSIQDWIGNLKLIPEQWKTGGYVHSGFLDAYHLLEHYVHITTDTISNVILTGHSLGGALALLAATTIPEKVHSIYTYGMPRVGDNDFCHQLKHLPIYNLVNSKDIVPKLDMIMGKVKLETVGDQYIFDEKGMLHENNFSADDQPSTRLQKLSLSSLVQPPAFVSDHAPVNYSYYIEQYILKNRT